MKFRLGIRSTEASAGSFGVITRRERERERGRGVRVKKRKTREIFNKLGQRESKKREKKITCWHNKYKICRKTAEREIERKRAESKVVCASCSWERRRRQPDPRMKERDPVLTCRWLPSPNDATRGKLQLKCFVLAVYQRGAAIYACFSFFFRISMQRSLDVSHWNFEWTRLDMMQ